MRAGCVLHQVIQAAGPLAALLHQCDQAGQTTFQEFSLEKGRLGPDPGLHLLLQIRPRLQEHGPAQHQGRTGKGEEIQGGKSERCDPQQPWRSESHHEGSGVGVRTA